MSKRPRSLDAIVQSILENASEKFGGCLIWNGPVDDLGYGYIKVAGKKTLVHRLIGLYGVPRTEEQVLRLQKLYMKWGCGHTVCLRMDSNHLHFSASKPEKQWESADALRVQYLGAPVGTGY